MQNAPISRRILTAKAAYFTLNLGHFLLTNGWLSRWKERINIVFKKLHVEKIDADKPAAKNLTKGCLPGLLNDYQEDETYNIDETGLFFRTILD